jgi:hypothetical protein
MTPRPLTTAELDEHEHTCLVIRRALSLLRLTRVQDEDIRAAMARLDNWLTEHDGRWTR